MSSSADTKTKVIALSGQPNTGKSTVFNHLTGAKQHVGNWPGKTVEQKSGEFTVEGSRCQLIDLPGTYSLTANSLEEKIARDFIINDKPDVVVVMADASQLERSLYLLTEVQMLPVPVILALNMMDVAGQQGKSIQIDQLEKRLGVRVVPMTAAKGEGLEDLVLAISAVGNEEGCEPVVPMLDGDPVYLKIKNVISGKIPKSFSEAWVTVKLIEKDPEIMKVIGDKLLDKEWAQISAILDEVDNGQLYAASTRYNWIAEVLASVVEKKGEDQSIRRGRTFDKAATHPVWGKLMAVLIMILGFAAAMIIAMPLMGVVQPAANGLASIVRSLFTGSSFWFGSLLADGLIPGLTVSLMMLAYIFGVYIVFGLLEDIGYITRLAYVFDRSMNRIGLHGKSFMPLLMSFGCNIAGVTGTRVIDSWQQRMVTLVLVSIVPCMALWAVVSFMGTIFFASAMPLVILSLLIVMLLHLSLTSFLLRRFIAPGETTGLIMELPPYHKPNWKTIFGHVWTQVKSFLKRACTLIALLSVVTWVLTFRTDGNMDLSVLATIAKLFDPVTNFLGLDWRLFVALMAATIAKEASLSVIAVLYGLGSASSITSFILGGSAVEHSVLAGTIAQTVNPASALAFIFAFFFSIPCLGTVATIHSETKSLKWTIGSSLYYIAGSLIAGGLAYRVGLIIF